MDGFDWKHPTDAMKGYKSPVDIYYSDVFEPINEAAENYIMAEIKMYVDVDKDELIKAMNYDRKQYATGYRNGYADAQKHGKWIYAENENGDDGYYCTNCHGHIKWNYKSEKIDYIQKYIYCPNCGARMDEDE